MRLVRVRTLNDILSTSPSKDELTPKVRCPKAFNTETNDFSSSSSEISVEESPIKLRQRNISILNQLGFCASPQLLTSKQDLSNQPYRRSCIGISDFWSKTEKEKFLKKQGFWETYKEIQKKDEMTKAFARRKNKFNSLPHILNLQSKKVIKLKKKLPIKCTSTRNCPKSTKHLELEKKSPKKLFKSKGIEELFEKCDFLTVETRKLKSEVNKFKVHFSNQCKEVKKNRKLT